MREVANNAQKLGVINDANESVQRACEIHAKLKDKKKWITSTEKRITDAKRAKANKQKHRFRQHFARKENSVDNTSKAPSTIERENTPATDSEKETDEDEKIHMARRPKQTATAKIAKELDSSDSEEEPTTEKGNPARAQQTTTTKTKPQAEQDSEEEKETPGRAPTICRNNFFPAFDQPLGS